MPTWLVVVLSVVAGHLATTAVVRWSRDTTIHAAPAPRCVADDHHRLSWGDALPVVSWARHRGRCRTCGASVPFELLAVELGAIVVTAAVLMVLRPATAAIVGPAAWSAVVAIPIDLRHRIIPNRLTLPLAAWTLAAMTAVAALEGRWGDWRAGAITAVAVAGGFLVLSLAFELLAGSPGLGMGDVKWCLGLGMACGWLGPLPVMTWLVGTVGTSGIVMVGLLVTRRATLLQRVPYGPYLAIGALLALVVLPVWVTVAPA